MQTLNTSQLALPPFDSVHVQKSRSPSRRQNGVAQVVSVATEDNTNIIAFRSSPKHLSLSSSVNLPAPLATTFNFVDELEQNREQYYAHTSEDSVVTIKNYPIAISESIETLCQLVTRYTAGITIGSSAAIAGGISTILAHEHIQTLLGLRVRFKEIRDLSADSEVRTIVAEWFKAFNLDLPHGQDKYKLVVPLPNRVFTDLSRLSAELGMSNPELAKICMMITLCGQTEVLDGYREQMGRYVESFWQRAWVRAEGTRCLLDRFGL